MVLSSCLRVILTAMNHNDGETEGILAKQLREHKLEILLFLGLVV